MLKGIQLTRCKSRWIVFSLHAQATLSDVACVHGSTNGIPMSFKVLPMVPLVKFPMVPLGEPRTDPLSLDGK